MGSVLEQGVFVGYASHLEKTKQVLPYAPKEAYRLDDSIFAGLRLSNNYSCHFVWLQDLLAENMMENKVYCVYPDCSAPQECIPGTAQVPRHSKHVPL